MRNSCLAVMLGASLVSPTVAGKDVLAQQQSVPSESRQTDAAESSAEAESHATEINLENGLLLINGIACEGAGQLRLAEDGLLVYRNARVRIELPDPRREDEYAASYRSDGPSGFRSFRGRASQWRNLEGRSGPTPRFAANRRTEGQMIDTDGRLDREQKGPLLSNPVKTVLTRIRDSLANGAVVVATDGHSLAISRNATQANQWMTAVQDSSLDVVLPAALSEQLHLVRADAPSMSKIRQFSNDYQEVYDANEASVVRNVWLNRVAYPLSTVGMLLVVIATGTLLSHRPPQGNELAKADPLVSPITIRFVAMIVGFSILDLIWTILATGNGTMRELNPLGSQFVENPWLLTLFKSLTTGLAVSILIYLRRFNRALLASWWMCLVLTLLTARWLAFNSLMV